MIDEKIEGRILLPFEHCKGCLLRIEEYSAVYRYGNGLPASITYTCEHADACNHAVKKMKGDEDNGRKTRITE